jgi:hypothetical protein
MRNVKKCIWKDFWKKTKKLNNDEIIAPLIYTKNMNNYYLQTILLALLKKYLRYFLTLKDALSFIFNCIFSFNFIFSPYLFIDFTLSPKKLGIQNFNFIFLIN